MEVYCVNYDGITFMGKGETNHWVVMDGPKTLRGQEAGPSPFELTFIGLGGCTGMDVASILQSKKVKYDRLEINVKTERAKEHPRVATKIEIEYLVYGKGLSAREVEEAIKRSQEKYCSVSAMLKKAAPLSWTYKIIES